MDRHLINDYGNTHNVCVLESPPLLLIVVAFFFYLVLPLFDKTVNIFPLVLYFVGV